MLNVANSKVQTCGMVIIQLRGDCMSPFLQEGDWGIFRKTSKLRIGQIYLLRQNNKLFVHRLLLRRGNVAWLKGDKSIVSNRVNVCGVMGELVSVIFAGSDGAVPFRESLLDRVISLLLSAVVVCAHKMKMRALENFVRKRIEINGLKKRAQMRKIFAK
jgi:hypothetical protein